MDPMEKMRAAISARQRKKLEGYVDEAVEPTPAYPEVSEALERQQQDHAFHFPDTGRGGDPFSAMQSVTSAPLRRGIAELLAGDSPGAIGRTLEQFGKDPETAPGWEELAGQAGVEDEPLKKTIGTMGDFLEPDGFPGGAISMVDPKIAKRLDSLGENSALSEKIGDLIKVGEGEARGGYGSRFKTEIFNNEAGYRRAIARDDKGNIIASILVKPDGSVAHATAQRGSGRSQDVDGLLLDLKDSMNGVAPDELGFQGNPKRSMGPDKWQILDKMKARAEVRELPPGGSGPVMSKEAKRAKFHQEPGTEVIEQQRGETIRGMRNRIHGDAELARYKHRKSQVEQERNQRFAEEQAKRSSPQGTAEEILKDPDTKLQDRWEHGEGEFINVFETTNPNTRNRVGIHLQDPDERQITEALEEANAKGFEHIFIHRSKSADVVPFPRAAGEPVQNPKGDFRTSQAKRLGEMEPIDIDAYGRDIDPFGQKAKSKRRRPKTRKEEMDE